MRHVTLFAFLSAFSLRAGLNAAAAHLYLRPRDGADAGGRGDAGDTLDDRHGQRRPQGGGRRKCSGLFGVLERGLELLQGALTRPPNADTRNAFGQL